ncbi:HAMP domain-containing sensor histidine kinase [Prolixibacteraceae bacterium Z1-6]|uniref:histidine kinase n=1 Tax=Draconibacterium aestuarii TaxID=2998507 RepID=A0A9X3J2X9_9BACT|nr:HAMP domain-containing sensor histidine kinase [Prolixibacteraceae bacterium Z1-6]
MRKFKFEYKITIIYLIVGGAWIIFSDKLIASLTDDNSVLTEMQTYKGWFYVTITAILLFFMVKNHLLKLRKAQQEAVESNRLKSAFLQNISHEIRTPMNSIIGFSNLLETENVSKQETSEYVANITTSSKQLLKIVDELMDISLIETGNMKVSQDKVNLNLLLDDIYNSFTPLIKNKIQFAVKKGLSDERGTICTDEMKLSQIISNLVTNANKYSEEGSITLSYLLQNNEIRFCVSDTGAGIPPQFHKQVFQRFRQLNTSETKINDGVGLGLSICKGNVELLGGKIWVESNPGKGSSFYFTIPYLKAE